MTQRFHLNHLFHPQKGMSLIEVAMAMGLISICVGLMLQVMGGNRIRMTQGGQNYASHAQVNSHQSHEYLFASSLANQLSNGDLTALNPIGANGRPECQQPININEQTFFGNSGTTPGTVPSVNPNPNIPLLRQTGFCTSNLNSKPVFYRWQVVRQNNPVTGNHTLNRMTFNNLPDANYPLGNQYYSANLQVFSAPNQQSFMFSLPVSIFRNVQAPNPIQSNLITSVSFDSSGSMDLTHNGLPRIVYAKESIREFVRNMQSDPYVGPNSTLALNGFNTTNTPIQRFQKPINYNQIYDHITCIQPADNECIGGNQIRPFGLTDLNTPMSFALSSIRNENDTLFGAKRDYERLWIFVSDGVHTTGNPNSTYNSMIEMARNNGFKAPKNDRITIISIGLLGADLDGNETANESQLRKMTQSTPYGVYIPTQNVAQLQAAFGSISNQFQFFALKHKPERWGVFL